MASLEGDDVTKRKENDELLCVVCNVRRIQCKGRTCRNPPCKRKVCLHSLMNRFRSEGEDKKLHCDSTEKRAEKEEPPKVCMYCLKTPVNIGRIVCFNKTCISRHEVAKFPPRIQVSTVNDEDKDSSEDDSGDSDDDGICAENDSSVGENEDSEDDGSCAESSCTPWDSDDSSDVIESNSELSEDETMLGNVDDEEFDESVMPLEQGTFEEDSDEDFTLQMCENCHRQPLFDHHADIPDRSLPYYFMVEEVEKDSVRFRRAFSNLHARDYDDEESVLLCTQCTVYLTLTGKPADSMEAKFPGYFWKLYSKTLQNM
jgi:hypothetical protein